MSLQFFLDQQSFSPGSLIMSLSLLSAGFLVAQRVAIWWQSSR
jgi:hypothetical protein